MIELKSVSKQYGERQILRNINISFQRGELTFITGTSGAGKTTLLNILAGLDLPTEGTVEYCGKDVSSDLCGYRAEAVGVIFQEDNLIPGLTAVQNVTIAAGVVGKKLSGAEVEEAVRHIGVPDAAQKSETLSGGEKQRIALLRSVFKEAEVLIADEPTGSLDSENSDKVFEMLSSMKEGRHIIVVSHDMEMAKKYADRILVLKDGVITEDISNSNPSNRITQEDDYRRRERNGDSTIEKPSGQAENRFGVRRIISLLGRNSICRRKGRFAMLVISIALAITALSLAIILKHAGNELNNAVNVSYLESDLLKLNYGFYPNAGYGRMPFSDAEILRLQKEEDVSELVCKYYYADERESFFSSDNGSQDAHLKQIRFDDFFRERVMVNDITGTFPERDNEVILAEDIANRILGDNPIGKEVWFHCGNSKDVLCMVVGINHTKNPFDKMYSFVSANLLKSMLESELLEKIYGLQMIFEWEDDVRMGAVNKQGIKAMHMQAVAGDESLLYGKRPEKPEQALISSKLFLLTLDVFGIKGSFSEEEVLSGKVDSDAIQRAFSKMFAIDYNGVFPVTFSGVFESEELEVRYTKERIDEMQIANPVGIDVYVKDARKAELIKSAWKQEYPYEVYAEQETLKDRIKNQSSFFEKAILILGGVLVVVSVAMLASYAKLMLGERKKEMAIIKGFGAKNNVVFGILSYDSVAITVAATVFAILLLLIVKVIGVAYISQLAYIGFGKTILLTTAMGIGFSLFVMLVTWLLFRRTVKKMPAELLRQ